MDIYCISTRKRRISSPSSFSNICLEQISPTNPPDEVWFWLTRCWLVSRRISRCLHMSLGFGKIANVVRKMLASRAVLGWLNNLDVTDVYSIQFSEKLETTSKSFPIRAGHSFSKVFNHCISLNKAWYSYYMICWSNSSYWTELLTPMRSDHRNYLEAQKTLELLDFFTRGWRLTTLPNWPVIQYFATGTQWWHGTFALLPCDVYDVLFLDGNPYLGGVFKYFWFSPILG